LAAGGGLIYIIQFSNIYNLKIYPCESKAFKLSEYSTKAVSCSQTGTAIEFRLEVDKHENYCYPFIFLQKPNPYALKKNYILTSEINKKRKQSKYDQNTKLNLTFSVSCWLTFKDKTDGR
jgi:hypothetical protein